MTWHLKDRELEKKLIAIDPYFVKTLTDTVEENLNQPNGWFDDKSLTEVELTYNGEFFGTAFFYTHELEEVPEYNPHDWNKFPQVIPPENVRMRVEFNYKDEPEKTYHACFYFFSGKWYWDTCKSSIASSIVNIRFRPWED